MQATAKAGYEPGEEMSLALDCAATEFFKDGSYVYEGEGKTRSRDGAGRLSRRAGRPLSDRLDRRRLAEDDLDGWKLLTKTLGDKMPARRRRFVRHQHRSGSPKESPTDYANTILIKVNQIGTLTETLEAVEMAHKAGYTAP